MTPEKRKAQKAAWASKPENRERDAFQHRKRRAANPEKYRAYDRARTAAGKHPGRPKTPEGREYGRIASAKFRAASEENQEDNRRRAREWKTTHPDQALLQRRIATLKQYDLTLDDFNLIMSDQKGCCAVCGKSSDKILHVDHDHNTGKVRGLLCHNCNTGIGHLGDDPARLRAAIKYLEGS